MIQTFADQDTREVNLTGNCRRWTSIAPIAARRLQALDVATSLDDLAHTPGNRLEKLSGYRVGQWSMRVDGHLRICFRWDGKDAWDVEIVEYR